MIDINDFLSEPIRSGMVAIVGPPNAGKSTLMNYLLGQKISIVSHKPQTTRNRILGVVNDDKYQIVLLDTPGLHKARQPLNREMVRIAMESLNEVDVIVYMIDVSLPLPEKVEQEKNKEMMEQMEGVAAPVILVLNKVDLLEKERLLPMMKRYSELFPFHGVLPLSALTGEGTEVVVEELLKLLPLGPRYFPEDVPTDASERFLAAEIVREKVFILTGQEIPYSTAVTIESFQDDETKKMTTIHATIVLERNSQKGIVIGKGGKKLKSIGTAARKDIEKMLGQKVLLKLWVKVRKDWSKDERFLKELGF
ncbi:GTP-binding protein Era [Desulfocapsa sulfexigens DSM 10523]|uniref:GTPase Era n=2 Tax=Desulfocapsa TaxID=53318 RepID=M1NK19_DESSD|nr:GTPase Era [Desulfocapsa sulfexigens]AGF79934.1 GTP-binding protein Era [Desulfocapsa sulfexigens DSM 10523]